ncbi:hypothetical protein TB1_008545 [Malus domestica]
MTWSSSRFNTVEFKSSRFQNLLLLCMVEYEGLARFVNADTLRVSDAREDQDHELEDLVIYGVLFLLPLIVITLLPCQHHDVSHP